MNDLPAPCLAGFGIFSAIVEIKDLPSTASGDLFHDFVKLGVGFHRAVFIGQHVGIEVREEREVSADVLDREVVCVGKNERWHFHRPQSGMQINHRVDGRENVREELREFFQSAAKTCRCADFFKELPAAEQSHFVAE
jgi:hypothetical protein